MRLMLLLLCAFSITSCWTKVKPGTLVQRRVWGNKPVYSSFAQAKQISYSNVASPVINAGNIYTKGNFLYQLDIGKGIHIIDNSIPAQAHRVAFIIVNGSSQISIKGNFLYTNSYDDLVVIDISNSNAITELKRVPGTFPEGRFRYYYDQPAETGYYECPSYDSAVIGWRKDSVISNCYKN